MREVQQVLPKADINGFPTVERLEGRQKHSMKGNAFLPGRSINFFSSLQLLSLPINAYLIYIAADWTDCIDYPISSAYWSNPQVSVGHLSIKVPR